jgi:cell wall-associated NlpC family hydrolase
MRTCHARRLPVIGALALLIARGVPAQSPAHTGRAVSVRGIVDGDALVATARRYLGVRYELGGSSPRAFDCSGFVRYVFARHGLTLPRTAHEQASLGRAPAPGELAPGDLLFFYGGRGAQHVAVYVGGDTIIHASSSGRRVKLDRLSGRGAHRNWFGQRLIAVRRVLPAEGVFELPVALAVPEVWTPGGEDPSMPVATLPRMF